MSANMSCGVTLRSACAEETEHVFELVQRTIREVYPLYYPEAVVRFFSELHSLIAVSADIAEGRVIVAEEDGKIVGTGTLDGNHITRVFVSPGSQGRGVGTLLLDELETQIAQFADEAELDSSLPAARFYKHRGYTVKSHEECEIRSATDALEAVLIYAIMHKPLH